MDKMGDLEAKIILVITQYFESFYYHEVVEVYNKTKSIDETIQILNIFTTLESDLQNVTDTFIKRRIARVTQ